MSLCEFAPLLSDFRSILQQEYTPKRLEHLIDFLDNFFLQDLELLSMQDERYFYSQTAYGYPHPDTQWVMTPTSAELIAAGAERSIDSGSEISAYSNSTPARTRALTVTSNDNPRAGKRRANHVPADETQIRHSPSLSQNHIPRLTQTGEPMSNTRPLTHDHGRSVRSPLPPALGLPATPFTAGGTQGRPMLPVPHQFSNLGALQSAPLELASAGPLNPPSGVINGSVHSVPRSPVYPPGLSPHAPLEQALVSACPALNHLTPNQAHHTASPHSQPTFASPSFNPNVTSTPVRTSTITVARVQAGGPSSTSVPSARALPYPPAAAATAGRRLPSTIDTPAAPNFSRPLATTLLNPQRYSSAGASHVSFSGRLSPPALAAAFSPHAVRTPKIARPTSPSVIHILSSSPPDVQELMGWACEKREVEDTVAVGGTEEYGKTGEHDDVKEYDETGEHDADSSLGDTEHFSAAWAVTHPPDLFPGGPKYISPNERTRLLSTSRHRKRWQLWEHGYIVGFFCNVTPPSFRLHAALLPGRRTAQGIVVHKSLTELSNTIFNKSRSPSSLHSELRSIAQTYLQIRSFKELTNLDLDYDLPYEQLIKLVKPRLEELYHRYPQLKGLTAWKFICYTGGGKESWYSMLHDSLKDHPGYSGLKLRSGAVSPAPARIGAPNGSRSGARGGSHAAGRNVSRGGAPRPMAKGKGKEPEGNIAIAESVSSLPSAPSSANLSNNHVDPAEVPRSLAPEANQRSPSLSLSVPRKPVPARTTNRLNSGSKSSTNSHDTHSPPDISQATAIEIIRETRASKRELDQQVIILKKKTDEAKLALLQREQERSEEFREKSYQLERERVAIEKLKTDALIESQRQDRLDNLLLKLREGGKQGANDVVYDDVQHMIQAMLKAGAVTSVAGANLGHFPLSIDAPAPAAPPPTPPSAPSSAPSVVVFTPPVTAPTLATSSNPRSRPPAHRMPSQTPGSGPSNPVAPPMSWSRPTSSHASVEGASGLNDEFGDDEYPNWWGKWSQPRSPRGN